MNKNLTIGQLLKILNNKIEKGAINKLQNLDMTKTQVDVLVFLLENTSTEINQRDIEKHFNLSNPTVTGILNRLEKKELIKRKSSLKGPNYKSIVLTNQGIELINELKEKITDFEEKLVTNLEKENIDILKNTLTIMINNISN